MGTPKASVEKLINLVSQFEKLDFESIKQIAQTTNLPLSFQEYDLDDAIIDLRNLLDILNGAQEKNLLESLGINLRNKLITQLENIKQSFDGIKASQNAVEPFIVAIDQLRELVTFLNLDFKLEGFPSYAKKREQLNQLIKLNEELSKKLSNATKSKEEADQILIEIKKSKDNESELLNTTKISSQTITNIERELTSKSSELETKFKLASDNVTNINTIKGEIEKFHGIIDNKRKELEGIINKSTNITDTNEKLESEIAILLAKATANNLFQAFGKRAEELSRRLKLWTILIVISLIGIIGMGIWIAHEFNGKGVDSWFIFRIFLTAPLLFALAFFSKQFSNDRKLQEEYSFKSTVSLSLPAYRAELQNITKQQEGKEENLAIVTKAMEKIFTSPTENISKNPIKDELNDTL